MSVTVAVAKKRTRFHLRDRDPSDYAFSTPEVERELEAAMRSVAADAKLGQDWTTLAITTTTDTFTMPGTEQFAQVLAVRLRSNGMTLEPLTREQFDALREGSTTAAPNTGTPQWYTLYETAAQALKIQVGPWPIASDTLDILCSYLPAAFVDDTTAIPFDDLAGEALAYRAASTLAAMAPPEALAKVGLNGGVAKLYAAEADKLVARSRVRRAQQRAAGRMARVVR